MSFLTSKVFWVDVVERAVKTFAQAAVAVLTSGVFGLLDVDWLTLVSVAGLAALVSVLTSVASGSVTKGESASLVQGEGLTYHGAKRQPK